MPAAKPKKSRAPVSTPAHGYNFKAIPVSMIRPTVENPRRFRKDQKFLELVENIRAVGLLQPIIVRPIRETESDAISHYDLRAGERRFHASVELGFTDIPAMVREMDDRTAFLVTVAENLNRDDLTPLEEASGIERLQARGWTVEQIADKIGYSQRWVTRRIALNHLCTEWREASESEAYANWGVTHLELIARFPEETQRAILVELASQRGLREGTVAQLRKHLELWLRLLRTAPWSLNDKRFGKAGACAACIKRSGCAPDLFDEPATGKNDRCLDPECWDEKMKSHIRRNYETLAKEHGEKLIVAADFNTDGLDNIPDNANVESTWQVERYFEAAEPNDTDAVPVLDVSGSNIGKTRWVKPINKIIGPGEGESTEAREKRLRMEASKSIFGQLVHHARSVNMFDKYSLPQLLAFNATLGNFYYRGDVHADDDPSPGIFAQTESTPDAVARALKSADSDEIKNVINAQIKDTILEFANIWGDETEIHLRWAADMFGLSYDRLKSISELPNVEV